MNAENIRIETDERGFELHVDTTDHGTVIINVQSVAEELLRACVQNIGPWLLEGYAVKRDMARTPFDHQAPWSGLTDEEREEEIRCAALGLDGPNAKLYRLETHSVHADHLRDRERGK